MRTHESPTSIHANPVNASSSKAVTMNAPLVSIAIITYNHGNYIRQCLEGVMMQRTNFDFEVVIGEDCSTDNTREIVKEFEKNYPGIIKPIYHMKNVGGARNAYEYCFPALIGKYIAICEGDDYWTDPSKLQKQVDFLEQNQEYVLSYHKINIVNDEGQFLEQNKSDDTIKRYNPEEIFHIKIPTLSVVFRNCIRIDPDEMMNVKSGDTYLFGLLSKFGGAAELGFVGADYRRHSGGVYTRMTTLDQYLQAIRTLKLMKRSESFSNDQKKEIHKEVVIRKKRYIRKFLQNLEFVNSLKIMFE